MKEWIEWLQVRIPVLKEKQNEFWLKQAIQEFADGQSISFAEWISDNGWNRRINGDWNCILEEPLKTITTTKLLEIFKNENNTKKEIKF